MRFAVFVNPMLGFVVLGVDESDAASMVAAASDQQSAVRIATLLNRFGMSDVDPDGVGRAELEELLTWGPGHRYDQTRHPRPGVAWHADAHAHNHTG